MKVKHLVIDASGFVKNLSLWEYGEELYSVSEVIAELRDKATRERYESLPIAIRMRDPQPWAIRFVNQFSKKTGDYSVLSLADVKILALTYELDIEAHGTSDHLRTEPQKCVVEGPSSDSKKDKLDVEGFHLPKEKLNNLKNSSVTHLDDTVMNCSFEKTQSDTYGDASPVMNMSNGQDFALSPTHCSPRNSTMDLERAETMLWCHLVGLEESLNEHSYIAGYVPTSDDSNMYRLLIKEYPQFRPSRKERNFLAHSALNLPPSSNVRPLHSTFPSIRRWSYHISSFSEEERNQFPSSDREIREVLQEFGTRVQNREGSCNVPEHIGQIPTHFGDVFHKDMKSLSLNGEEHPKEEGNEESDREDDLSEITDEGNLHVQETDEEGEEADIEYEDDSDETEERDFYEEHLSENNQNEEDVAFDQNEDDDDDDDEGWITPSNIRHCKLKEKKIPVEEEEEKEKDVLVACVTSDFAVQNVLKHIGLSVMGVEGKIIRQIKTFTLRCYACFKLCSDMSKIFCPKCGNKTLKRVSVTVNPDGTQKIWINFKKRINTRGMIFSLPRPKGGQHARNPILVADQKEVRQFSSKMSKKKTNPLHEDYDPDAAPFAIRDVYTRAAQLGYMADRCHNHYYWEKKNPNERTKKYKKKKNFNRSHSSCSITLYVNHRNRSSLAKVCCTSADMFVGVHSTPAVILCGE